MNKTELIAAVAEKTDLSKKDADAAVSAVLGAITDALKAGDKIQLVGFGTFEVRNRAAKQGRNPRTGETMTVPASKVPAFKAGKALKDAFTLYIFRSLGVQTVIPPSVCREKTPQQLPVCVPSQREENRRNLKAAQRSPKRRRCLLSDKLPPLHGSFRLSGK